MQSALVVLYAEDVGRNNKEQQQKLFDLLKKEWLAAHNS